jgi:hypothetical protein
MEDDDGDDDDDDDLLTMFCCNEKLQNIQNLKFYITYQFGHCEVFSVIP